MTVKKYTDSVPFMINNLFSYTYAQGWVYHTQGNGEIWNNYNDHVLEMLKMGTDKTIKILNCKSCQSIVFLQQTHAQTWVS